MKTNRLAYTVTPTQDSHLRDLTDVDVISEHPTEFLHLLFIVAKLED